MRQRDTISSNSEAHLVLHLFSTTDDGFIQSRSLFFHIWPCNIPALWKFIIKYQLCGQIISENNQVAFVHNYSHWKILSLTTIEPQKSRDDSNLTDKWHHPIATGPGEFFSFRLVLARDVMRQTIIHLIKMTSSCYLKQAIIIMGVFALRKLRLSLMQEKNRKCLWAKCCRDVRHHLSISSCITILFFNINIDVARLD